jgi:creatinine amidohydrolase
MPPKHQWTELTWEDFAQRDPASWIAVLPIAAVEQHGPHLPLGVDAYIAEAYLARVHANLPDHLPVVFLPLQVFGQSDEHLAYPGTLTLSVETLLRTLGDIGSSVYRAGVRKLLIVTSHGGNWQAAELAARDLRVRFGMFAVLTSWHRFGYPDGLFAEEERRHGIHAGGVETALMLATRPDLVARERATDFTSAAQSMAEEFRHLRLARPAGFGWMTQDLNPAGAVGNAGAATAAMGETALAHGAQAFIELLEDMARFDIRRLAEGPLS